MLYSQLCAAFVLVHAIVGDCWMGWQGQPAWTAGCWVMDYAWYLIDELLEDDVLSS